MRVIWCAAVLAMLATPLASAQLIHIPTETPEQGKWFSEFNHRMAGVFLVAIGALASASAASTRLSFLGKLWPFFFILPGLYLAAMSDPEVWPMGTQNWVEVFKNNPEARQHKIFAMLMLAMGILEFQRARGRLGQFLATWSFPALAVFGAVLLFFHPHNVDEPGSMAHHMPGMSHEMPAGESAHGAHVMTATMLKVQNQHFHDAKFWRHPWAPFVWPCLMVVLGILLIRYAE
jgi:hypothetical protein